jgi:hypothetical protein
MLDDADVLESVVPVVEEQKQKTGGLRGSRHFLNFHSVFKE